VDDPSVITDDESPAAIPETDPAASNGEAPPPSGPDVTPAPKRRRAAATAPAESS
jgi:hypothetical protein